MVTTLSIVMAYTINKEKQETIDANFKIVLDNQSKENVDPDA